MTEFCDGNVKSPKSRLIYILVHTAVVYNSTQCFLIGSFCLLDSVPDILILRYLICKVQFSHSTTDFTKVLEYIILINFMLYMSIVQIIMIMNILVTVLLKSG